jgi:hypothetical protein
LSCSATRWPKQDTKRFLPSQRDSAFAQAYTSASFKIDTTALVERSKTVSVLASLFKLPHLLLLSGGIAINVGDEVVGAPGAAGAPGGDFDDACARAGLDKITATRPARLVRQMPAAWVRTCRMHGFIRISNLSPGKALDIVRARLGRCGLDRSGIDYRRLHDTKCGVDAARKATRLDNARLGQPPG